MNSLNLNDGLSHALSKEALRRDGIRIALLLVATFLSVALNFPRAFQVVLGGLDGLVIILCVITTLIAALSFKKDKAGALRGIIVYGSLLVGCVIAFGVVFF
jgi:hypothetical protein